MKNKDVVVLEEEEYQLDFDIEFVFCFFLMMVVNVFHSPWSLSYIYLFQNFYDKRILDF